MTEYDLDDWIQRAKSKKFNTAKKVTRLIEYMWDLADNYKHPKEDRKRLLIAIFDLVELKIPPGEEQHALEGLINPTWIPLTGKTIDKYKEEYTTRMKRLGKEIEG